MSSNKRASCSSRFANSALASAPRMSATSSNVKETTFWYGDLFDPSQISCDFGPKRTEKIKIKSYKAQKFIENIKQSKRAICWISACIESYCKFIILAQSIDWLIAYLLAAWLFGWSIEWLIDWLNTSANQWNGHRKKSSDPEGKNLQRSKLDLYWGAQAESKNKKPLRNAAKNEKSHAPKTAGESRHRKTAESTSPRPLDHFSCSMPFRTNTPSKNKKRTSEKKYRQGKNNQ